jgi:hypothetical protein
MAKTWMRLPAYDERLSNASQSFSQAIFFSTAYFCDIYVVGGTLANTPRANFPMSPRSNITEAFIHLPSTDPDDNRNKANAKRTVSNYDQQLQGTY